MTEPRQGSYGHLPPVSPRDENPYRRPHRAKTLMLYALLSLVGIFPLGLLAWIMADIDLSRMRQGRMDPSGESETRKAKRLGIAGLVLGVLVVAGLVWLIGWMVKQLWPLLSNP